MRKLPGTYRLKREPKSIMLAALDGHSSVTGGGLTVKVRDGKPGYVGTAYFYRGDEQVWQCNANYFEHHFEREDRT